VQPDQVSELRSSNDASVVSSYEYEDSDQPMDEQSLPADLRDAIRFHGHLCPGLTIGYRAARIGLERLGERAKDEELIAIVENDSCAVDAVQYLTGCTFGKGNLFFRDHGKQVFTFARRPSGKAVRVSLKPVEQWNVDKETGPEQNAHDAMIELMLTVPAEGVFSIEEKEIELPGTARIHETLRCATCGEPVMSGRTRTVNGQTVCIPCAAEKQAGGKVTS